MPTAIASECAGEQGKFWEYHDKLFENQQALEDPNLEKYAEEIKVDVGKWKACVGAAKPKDKITRQQQLMNNMGARGTPAFFINGRFLSGARPVEHFKTLIDEELKKAKASGVAGNEYYQKAVVEKGEKKL